MSDRGTYNWPEAEPNHIDSQMCQYAVMIGQNITGYCNTNLTWTYNSSKCPTVVTDQFTQLNSEIKNVIKHTHLCLSLLTCIYNTSKQSLYKMW